MIVRLFALKVFMFFSIIVGLSYCQSIYTGTVGKAAIELVVELPQYKGDTAMNGVYLYKKYNNPILLSGSLKQGMLSLFESDTAGNKTGQFIFSGYDRSKKELSGNWENLNTKASISVALKLKAQVGILTSSSNAKTVSVEVLQCARTERFIFKLMIFKHENGQLYVSGVKAIERKTGNVIQIVTPKEECQYLEDDFRFGLNIEDYNFDGNPDFSLYSETYGTTEKRYFVFWDSANNRFYKKGFVADNFNIDPEKKVVAGFLYINANTMWLYHLGGQKDRFYLVDCNVECVCDEAESENTCDCDEELLQAGSKAEFPCRSNNQNEFEHFIEAINEMRCE